MSTGSRSSAAKAVAGKKMIEVRLRFWTDGIAPTKGEILRKHAWTSGVVRMQANSSHGIVPRNPKPFQSLLDIGAVIEEALIEHGVVLHNSRRMKKYMADTE